MTTPTQDSLKEKAKVIRKFLNEKYSVDVSHGHCMELISQIFGFKDWNTAAASLKPKLKSDFSPMEIETVGDMKKALELFDNSASIDGMYEFNLQEFIDELDPNELDGTIYQEFSLFLDKVEPDIASFRLEIEHESIGFQR